jgi:hypothetical protein
MAIGRPLGDLSKKFNSTYDIRLDLSGWTETAIHVVPPLTGAIVVTATNDSGAQEGITDGGAKLAINFSPALVTNISTSATTTIINSYGIYKYLVDAQFLRLQGSPAAAGTNVYKLLLFNSKVD